MNENRFMGTFLLLRPKILSSINRLLRSEEGVRNRGAVFLLSCLGLSLIGGMFAGTVWVLRFIAEHTPEGFIHPTTLLSSLFSLTGAILLISNSVIALSVLYNAKDIELILSAPISRVRFFFGRFADIVITSSATSFGMTLPILYGFGYVYHPHVSYYFFSPLVLALFLFLPAALSTFFVTATLASVPVRWMKDFFLIIGAGILVMVLFVARHVFLSTATATSISEIVLALQSLSLPYRNGSPPFWAASALGAVLKPSTAGEYPALLYLTCGSALSVFVAFCTVCLGFHRALASFTSSKGIHSERWSTLLRTFLTLRPFSLQVGTLIHKELVILAREPAQLFQIVLLGGLSSLYLYNFSFLTEIDALPDGPRQWWQMCLILIHLGLLGFLLTAAANRFAFPALSMERQAIWLTASAPVSLRTVLLTKFLVWLVILGTPTVLAVAWGTMLITQSVILSLLTAAIGGLQSITIVGLATGLGARFVRFDWEHFTQLAASAGSILFMIVSLFVIAFFSCPTAIILAGTLMSPQNIFGDPFVGNLCALFSFVLLLVVSLFFTWGVISLGEKELRYRLK